MKTRKPAWWQLYMLVPIMFVLLAVQHLAPLPGVSDEVVDAGIVVVTFSAMLVWVHLNGGLLEHIDLDKDESIRNLKITVYEPVSKEKGDGDGSDSDTPFVLTGPITSFRGQTSIRLKEEQKWFLN